MTIRLIALYNGEATPDDGRYVVDYDPKPRRTADGIEWVYLVTTDDPAKARQFQSAQQALEFWRMDWGIRGDGKPNRPLTAYSVEIG